MTHYGVYYNYVYFIERIYVTHYVVICVFYLDDICDALERSVKLRVFYLNDICDAL